MRPTIRRSLRTLLPVLLVGIAVMAIPGVADARVRPGDAVLVVKTRRVTSTNTPVAMTARCPAGDRAITGGAYWHRFGQDGSANLDVRLDSTAPAPDGRGWYAAGTTLSEINVALTVTAQCLPSSAFAQYSIKQRDVIVDPLRSGSAVLRCPRGSVPVMGGGVWHLPRQAPAAGFQAWLSGSWPDQGDANLNQPSGWSIAGWNQGTTVLALRAIVFCLPAAAVGHSYGFSTYSWRISAGQYADHYLFCPTGERVLGGGSYFAYPQDGATNAATLSFYVSSTANGNGGSWYLAVSGGDRHEPTQSVVEAVICMAA